MKVNRLLNFSEEKTFEELNSVVSEYNLRVDCKTRVADVFPIEKSGISNDLYSYALKAHFDFVITDKDHMPQFAVEFDGPTHDATDTQALDAKKNQICQHFEFPLLRLSMDYLSPKYNEMSLLQWIIHVHCLEKLWDEAQSRGEVPYDEPFDPIFLMNVGEDKRRFPFWISLKAKRSLEKLRKQGTICLEAWGLIGTDPEGTRRGIEFIKIDDTHGILVKVSMRQQLFPNPIPFIELLQELLIICVYEQLQVYLSDGSGSISLTEAYDIAKEYKSKFKAFPMHGTNVPPWL
jgi:hypothetical protein